MKEELDYTMWVTSGTRFSQSNRYDKLQSTIYFSLLMLSVYLTIASLITPRFFPESQSLINLFTVSASILITILVILLKSANLAKRSRLQHECGRKVRKLLYDLKAAKTDKEIEEVSNNYNSILDDFENHSKIDFCYFWYENYDKADKSKRGNAPHKFLRNFIAPLVFTFFPIATKVLAFLGPPVIFAIIVI